MANTINIYNLLINFNFNSTSSNLYSYAINNTYFTHSSNINS